MTKKGINSRMISDEAAALVVERGYSALSLRELAARLDVKPASLYNHISGIEEINEMLALHTSEMLRTVLEDAVIGKERDEAFLEGARAYRRFAIENFELYRAMIRFSVSENEAVTKAAMRCYRPLRRIVESYGAGKPATTHFLRALRSVMHGFIELSCNNYMQRGSVDRDESYEVIIRGYLDVLKGLVAKDEVNRQSKE